MKQKLILVFLAISVYYFSGWIEQIASIEKKTYESSKLIPESFFTHFSTKRMNKNGILQDMINGEIILNYQDNTSLITKPIVTIYEDGKVHWIIKSNNAELDKKDGSIRFIKSVTANNTIKENSLLFQADNMTFLNKENIIKTDQKVSILSDNFFTTAIGMFGNTKTGTYQLLNKVRSIYYDN